MAARRVYLLMDPSHMDALSASAKPKLLIVDDDEEIRTQMKWAVGQDYDVLLAEDRTKALATFGSHRPAVVILDLGLPPRPNEPEEGFSTLSGVLDLERTAKVIIISGQSEKENALRAVGSGAFDFLCKPIEVEELKFLLRRCFYVANLESEYRNLQLRSQEQTFEGLIGTSPQMQQVFATIRKVATTSAPVLLLGESGTGKEMVAEAIHRRSLRKDRPFIPINCSAIPENLLESELFGHEKGSFTGAHVQRKGLIENAEKGTLFLDEIGDLPLSIQVKILRFLQEQTFMRVGGRQEIQCDVRIIAATNADLKHAIASGSFREDLYFRLAVVVVTLPPLEGPGRRYSCGSDGASEAIRRAKRQDGLDLCPGNFARREPLRLAGKCARTAKQDPSRGDHGGWKANHSCGYGARPCRTSPSGDHSQGSEGKHRARDGPSGSQKKRRQDQRGIQRVRYQPSNTL